jgi:hypothetical protein
MKGRLAEALEEVVVQQRQLALQARMQEGSQTSVRAAIRMELQAVELAEQRAAVQSRAEMAATLGARGEALIRSLAELEVANFRATAEINSLARAREAELQVRTEAQRLREQAEDAARVAAAARAEAETIRALRDSRLHQTEQAAEAKVAEKSANLVIEAEQAVRQRVDQCQREARDEQLRFREEVAELELRKRTQIADQEFAAREEQQRLRREMEELELRKRTQLTHHELLRERSEAREKSRDSDTGRVYSALMERMQQGMAAIHRQAQEDRERMAREIRVRDALFMADSQQKQQAIDQLTEVLSATLSRLQTSAAVTAPGGAPPPPPGGGDAPGTGKGESSGRPKKALPLPAASSHALSGRPTKTGPPAPPPGGGDGSDSSSSESGSSRDED